MQQSKEKNRIEVQGHRGDRGNFPENTIPAFLSAVKKGVDVLELDVVISKDKKVVVSHEPFMSSEYMLTPTSQRIYPSEEKSYNLFKMDYDSIRQFDAGFGRNSRFLKQKKIKTYKPLLSEAIDTIENYVKSQEFKPVGYNIEIKSDPKNYGSFQPYPEEFVDLVMQVIQEGNIEEKVVMQSFDPEPLHILRENYPEIPVSFLVENGSLNENLGKLNFLPEVYSPHFSLLKDSTTVSAIKTKGLQVIPWTVNERQDIQRMIDLKVDAIISDYPEKVISLLKKQQQ